MTIHLTLTVVADQLFVHHADSQLTAPTPVATLPRIDGQANPFRYNPYGLGLTLYQALGGAALTALLDRDPDQTLYLITDAASAAIPWEYAASADRTFLACAYAFLRLLPTARPASAARPGPLNLVALAADPLVDEVGEPRTGYKLAIEDELAAIAARLQTSANAVVARRIPPTRDHLQRALRQGPALLHLSCHGTVISTELGNLAILQLEDAQGKAAPLRSDQLLRLPPPGVLRLALLSACRSAASALDANLAQALVHAGVPAAVGMQGDFPDAQSDELAATLYQFLLDGYGLGEALRQARVAMIDHPYAVGLPVGYIAPDGDAPLPLQPGPVQVTALRSPSQLNLPTALLPPTFLGREGELHALAATFSPEQRVVTVVGTGGIGKTALSGAFARRFGWRWPGGVIGVTLAELPTLSPESFVNELLRRLLGEGVATQLADQGAAAQAETLIVAAQERQPLLLIDNYESVLEAMVDQHGEPDAPALAPAVAEAGPEADAPTATLAVLRHCLAELYPDESNIARLVVDAELPLVQIALNSTPLNNWHALLTEAIKRGRMAALLCVVEAEYPTNGRLRSASAAYWRAGGLPPSNAEAQTLRANATRLHRLVATFANSGLSLLLTSRRQPAGLAGEVIFPPPGALEGVSVAAGAALFFQHSTRARADQPAHDALAQQVAAATEGHPLAIALLAGEFDLSTEVTPAGFLADWGAELAAAERHSQAAHHIRYEVAFERSFRHLDGAAQQRLIALSRFPAPFFVEGAGYLWAELDGVTISTATATASASSASATLAAEAEPVEAVADEAPLRRQLDDFVRRSLLRTQATFTDSDRTATWRLEPVIARTLQRRLDEETEARLQTGYFAYGNWLVNYVYSKTGSDVALAQLTQQWLDALTSQAEQQPRPRRASYCWQLAYLARQLGRMKETQGLLTQGLAAANAQQDKKTISNLSYEQANLLVTLGDLDRALALYQQSREIDEQLGDLQGKSASLHAQANVYRTRGDLDRALALYQQSLAIKDQLGDIKGKSATLHEIAYVYVTRGDLDRALALYQQSLAIQEQLGDIQGKSATLHQMANVYVTRGDLDRALALYQQSLAIQDQLGDIKGKGATLSQMADLYSSQGELEKAEALLDAALQIAKALGEPSGIAFRTVKLGQIAQARGDLATARQRYQAGIDLFTRLGMPEANQVRQMLAALDQPPAAPAPTLAEQITILRQQPPTQPNEQQLSVLLYNQALELAKAGEVAAAIARLEEVVQIDKRWGLADLAADQEVLAQLRGRQAGTVPTAAAATVNPGDLVAAWQAQLAHLPPAEQPAMRTMIEHFTNASPAEQAAMVQAMQAQALDAQADDAVAFALAAIADGTQVDGAHKLAAAAAVYGEDAAVGSPYWQLAQLVAALAALLAGEAPGPVAAVNAARLARVQAALG